MYEGQLTETRAKKTEEITELDGRLQHEYETRLQESLQDLRDQYEAQMRANREEIEAIYNLKVRGAVDQRCVDATCNDAYKLNVVLSKRFQTRMQRELRSISQGQDIRS